MGVGVTGAAVGDAGATVGDAGTTVGETGAMVGDSGAMVGDSGAMVGESGAMVGESGAMVGDNGATVGDAGAIVGDTLVGEGAETVGLVAGAVGVGLDDGGGHCAKRNGTAKARAIAGLDAFMVGEGSVRGCGRVRRSPGDQNAESAPAHNELTVVPLGCNQKAQAKFERGLT